MIQDKITQYWVKVTGRKINPETDKWLMGPIGNVDIIGNKFIQNLVKDEDLKYSSNIANAGLLENISDLDFTQDELDILNKQVIDFYLNLPIMTLKFGANGKVFSNHLEKHYQ